MCLCESECAVVLGAGAETLCGEHDLMSTAVQCPAIHLFLLSTNTQDVDFTQALSSAVCTGSGDTPFGICIAVGLTCTHGKRRE